MIELMHDFEPFYPQNALKKQTSGSSGGEHVVYERDQGHGGSWQRNFVPEMPEKWNQNLIWINKYPKIKH